MLERPIKTLGIHPLRVALHPEVSVAIRVNVAQSEEEARMQADVESGAIIVEGEVKGNLVANDRIELKQSARLEGDLRATKLTVDEGAVFSGHVTVGPDAVKNRPPQAGRPSVSVTVMPQSQPQPVK